MSRLTAHEERYQQPADPVTLEVERDRDARPRTPIERIDSDIHGCPDGPIDTMDGPSPWRIDRGDLRRDPALGETDAPGRHASGADAWWMISIHTAAHNVLLPCAEP